MLRTSPMPVCVRRYVTPEQRLASFTLPPLRDNGVNHAYHLLAQCNPSGLCLYQFEVRSIQNITTNYLLLIVCSFIVHLCSLSFPASNRAGTLGTLGLCNIWPSPISKLGKPSDARTDSLSMFPRMLSNLDSSCLSIAVLGVPSASEWCSDRHRARNILPSLDIMLSICKLKL